MLENYQPRVEKWVWLVCRVCGIQIEVLKMPVDANDESGQVRIVCDLCMPSYLAKLDDGRKS